MKPLPSLQKLRGGYYTPEVIGSFLADWAIQKPTATVLEPSCGDGVFLEAAAQRLRQLRARPSRIAESIVAAEIDAKEATKAERRMELSSKVEFSRRIHRGDFFQFCRDTLKGRKFDAILGNPPFIRYQHFPAEHRDAAFELMQGIGLRPNRLTNAWLPFIALSIELLSEHGRLAMVVPAELLQVNYAAELRQMLSEKCHRLTVFTFRRLVFEGIQQEVVLLCAERDGGGTTGIRAIELEDLSELAAYEHTPFDRQDLKPMDHSKEKWTQYFLTRPQIALLRSTIKSETLPRLGTLADVEVGVVTGMNDFFVLRREGRDQIGADGHSMPLVSRSGHLEGITFTRSDWRSNVRDELPAFLLNLPGVPLRELPSSLAEYVREGEKKGWHSGYKCRIRSPWYKVPSIWIPDGFMLRQIHDRPRIFANEASATSTDTIHRVRAHLGTDVVRLAGAAYNSLTFAFSEVLGRSYGGGVLELEPREATQLPVPYQFASKLNTERLDRMLRNGDGDEALDYADDVLLRKGMGLSEQEVRQFRRIWMTLRDRRAGRKLRPEAVAIA